MLAHNKLHDVFHDDERRNLLGKHMVLEVLAHDGLARIVVWIVDVVEMTLTVLLDNVHERVLPRVHFDLFEMLELLGEDRRRAELRIGILPGTLDAGLILEDIVELIASGMNGVAGR